MTAAALYPVFLKLAGKRVLLVGAGRVASSKLPGLLDSGARVTVVAPQIGEGISRPGVEILQRPFSPEDLQGVWFVVAAAPPDVNRVVALAAEQRSIFVNAVDDKAAASAFLGGVVRRDGVTVALSTDGKAPALSGLLREGIDRLLPAELGQWLTTAESLRQKWKAQGTPMHTRRPELLSALNDLYAQEQEEEP